MKHLVKLLLSMSLAVLIATPLLAADQERKGKGPRKKPDPGAQILQRLEKAELTEEQVTKIKEIAAANAEKLAAARPKLSDEQRKARMEIIKKAKADGKSREEVMKLLKDSVKLTPEQEKAMEAANEARRAMFREVMDLLTPEQKKALGKGRGGKRPGKKAAEKKGDG
jgi:Spy/CpxP family protein refolding chaperone